MKFERYLFNRHYLDLFSFLVLIPSLFANLSNRFCSLIGSSVSLPRRSSDNVLGGLARSHNHSGYSESGLRGGSEPFFKMLTPVATVASQLETMPAIEELVIMRRSM